MQSHGVTPVFGGEGNLWSERWSNVLHPDPQAQLTMTTGRPIHPYIRSSDIIDVIVITLHHIGGYLMSAKTGL